MTNGQLGPIERFYLHLIALGSAGPVERTLDTALALLVEISEARLAYVELWDHQQTPTFWRGHHNAGTRLEAIRRSIPRAFVAQAVVEGRTVEGDHEGSRTLCFPIGQPSCGILYLEKSSSANFDATGRASRRSQRR